jgi:cytochrome oxidase assembly protein ShyY1
VIRSLLAPRWLAWHGALVVVLVAFILLGRWQLDSFEESDQQEAATPAQALIGLNRLLEPGQRLPADGVGRAVTASGRYEADHQLLVPGRRLDGRDGFLVVTPLRTSEGVVPVDRGWVATRDAPGTAVPPGEVVVTGVTQPSESERDSRVDVLAALPANQVPYLATVILLDALPYSTDELYDGYVVLTSQRPPARPGPALVQPQQRGHDGVGKWRNLGYALQWWFFAGAAVFFWWSVIRRSLQAERDEPEVEESEPAAV